LLRKIDLTVMQIIRALPVSADDYVATSVHKRIEPPGNCPHCGATNALKALGYYSRNVTSPKRGVLRIFVRRFRCCECGKTVSVLPSFVQPYRLVLNLTIDEYFGGTLNANALSWLPLLKQYWNRFSNWHPRIDRIIRSVVSRSPPHSDASGWWKVMVATLGDLEKITTVLVDRFGVTLFGRYRCHSPFANGPPPN
jgi:transposase